MKRLMKYFLLVTVLGLTSCSTTHFSETDIYTQHQLNAFACLKSAAQSTDNESLPSLIVANHIVQQCHETISAYEQSRSMRFNTDSTNTSSQRLAHWVLLSNQVVLESRTGLPFP